METQEKTQILTPENVSGPLLSFLSKGIKVSRQERGVATAAREPGLDVFVAYTPDRAPKLIQNGMRVSNGVKQVCPVSLLVTDPAGNICRAEFLTGQPLPADMQTSAWWSIALLEYASPAQAEQAMHVAKDNKIPLGYFPDLMEISKENKDAQSALNSLANLTRKGQGIPGFETEVRVFSNPRCLVFLAAPSGIDRDGTSMWANATTRTRTTAQAGTRSARTTTNAGNGIDFEMP